MKRYKVGIIGCGRMGWLFNEDRLIGRPVSHISAYKSNKRTKITALCDIDGKRLDAASRRYGVDNLYTDYRQMLAREDLDIVSICTPTQTHAEVCLRAASAGVKAILCEKPIASSLDEAQKMIGACRKRGVRLAVNHTRVYDSSFLAVRDVLEKKKIGDLIQTTAFATAGLLNGGTHLFSLLIKYFGRPAGVSGSLIPDGSTDPGALGVVRFKSGIRCFTDCTFRDYVLFGADIYGERGMIEIRERIGRDKTLRIFIGKKSAGESGMKELKPAYYKGPKRTPPIANAVRNIVDALDGKEAVFCTGKDGKASLEIALAFHESSRKGGREIPLPLKNRRLRVIPRETSFTKDGRLR